MKQLVKILFHIENKKEQVDKVVSGLHKFFSIPHQDAYEILSEELEELKRVKGALKGLCGISRALENKLKTLSNDIRTISES